MTKPVTAQLTTRLTSNATAAAESLEFTVTLRGTLTLTPTNPAKAQVKGKVPYRNVTTVNLGRGDEEASRTRFAYSIDELVELLPIGRSTIYEELRTGALVGHKLGRRTVILPSDVEAWLSSCARRP